MIGLKGMSRFTRAVSASIWMLCLLLPMMAKAQGASVWGQALTPTGKPAAFATLRICPITGGGIPCSPLSSVFSDLALTQPVGNPYTSDQNGNFSVFVNPGAYIVQLQVAPATTYSYLVTTGGSGSSVTLQTNGVNNASQSVLNLVAGTGVTLSNSGSAVTINANGDGGGARIPNSRINQSFSTKVFVIGDSIGAGAGASSTATQWANVFNSLSGIGTLTNDSFAGFVIADTQNFGLLGVHPGGITDLDRSYNQQPFDSGLTFIYNSDNEATCTACQTASYQIAYQQQFLSTVALAGTASVQWIVPYNTAVATSGTIVQDNFAPPLPTIENTTVNGTISYSGFITNGGPIYWIFPIFAQGDGGSFTFTIDGVPNQVDTITNSSTIANTPFGGNVLLTSQSYTQTFAAVRFPVAAGTHTITQTCTIPGVHGCGLAAILTSPRNSTEWSIPTVGIAGTIHELSDANSAGTATYNALNQSITTLAANDGFNTAFVDVRSYIPLSFNTAAMSGTDGFGPQAIVRTDITFTAGQPLLTSANPFSQLYDGMQAFCLNAATSSTTLYTTVSVAGFDTNLPDQLTLVGAPGVSSGAGTGTCWFGWPGQIWRASTNPGLHPNDFGHQLIARAFLGALQPVTVPPVFNNFTTFNGGASFNCGIPIPDCVFLGAPGSTASTAPIKRIDILGGTNLPADGWGLPFDALSNGFADAVFTNSASTPYLIGYMSGATNTNANYTWPFRFSPTSNPTFGSKAGFTSTLPIYGQQLIQTNGEATPTITSSYVLNTLFASQTVTLATNSNFYLPVGFSSQVFTQNVCQGGTPFTLTPQVGVVGNTQPTNGSGQTPGTYNVPGVGGGGTGAALTWVVGSGGTLVSSIIASFGTGYTSAPTFTAAAGGTPSTATGIISAPIVGFYFNNGGVVDATPNACSTQSFRYLPSKLAWYADGFLPTVGTTVAASFCNQSGTLTGVAGCLVQTISGATHYVPFF
jgi:hypothetical protein